MAKTATNIINGKNFFIARAPIISENYTMFISRLKPKPSCLKDQKGQTFLEFIFILMILISISFAFMKGFSYLIGSRWEIMLKIIARPNTSSIQIP
jgi:hypothetical protein